MEYLNSKLKGEQLSSVEFVQDYLQLHFDGKYLIAYIWPDICNSDNRYTYGQIDYRNKLCEFIGKIIKGVYIEDGKELNIFFKNENGYIHLNLDPDNPDIVGDIAMFHDSLDESYYIL
ncbi:MAG: hypothetical protein E6767_20895 [Dysgonomonas sp.]|nr:hypothetical protein [Dysgonomonas sp.]